MQSQAHPLISLFRTSALAGVTAFLITSAALPMPAQNSVPPTAVQAARMPEFAQRLAHPARRPASPPNPALPRQGSRSGPPQDGSYDNGPINGTTDAWTINFGYVVSDTFTMTGSGTVSAFDLGLWEFPFDVLSSVQWSITSGPNSGTVYGSGTVSGGNLTDTFISTNQYGYNIDLISASGLSVDLNAGTFWFNLQNASVPNGDPVYWDENSGVGCMSPGCPSQAESAVGTIPSEAFDIGNGSPTCFQSQGKLQIIYNFTEQEGGGEGGVVMDQAGNLYGTSYSAGDNGQGFAYKLDRFANWLLDPLFSFLGGSSGGEPNGVIVGPKGSLYGGAQGGIQNCASDGSQYCGLVFNLRPQPTTCANALCGWMERVLYRFSSESDGSGWSDSVNVSAYDQQGNLYGTTPTGGAFAAGTVFELRPSGESWTKSTLYSFIGGADGKNPNGVLVGNDGSLYGTTYAGGMLRQGVVFQLTSSGGGWTESIIHDFSGSYYDPTYLVQDSAGNLYGIIADSSFPPRPAIFTLQKTGPGWGYSEIDVSHGAEHDYLNNLTIDAAGNLYSTGTYRSGTVAGFLDTMGRSSGHSRSPVGGSGGYIFKAWYDSGGWHGQELALLPNTYFDTGGSLALDPSGNLYGTTSHCGAHNDGTVWQLSP